jgi:hypothetical protein
MKNKTIAVFLFALTFVFIWAGAYILHILPDNSWAEFPTLMTATYLCAACFMASVILFLKG